MGEQQRDGNDQRPVFVGIDSATPRKQRTLLRLWPLLAVVLLLAGAAIKVGVTASSGSEALPGAPVAATTASVTSSAWSTSVAATASSAPSSSPARVTAPPLRRISATVDEYAAWVSGARALLGGSGGDSGLVQVGVAICKEVPVSEARTTALSVDLRPDGGAMTPAAVRNLSMLAQGTICPGGGVLTPPANLSAALSSNAGAGLPGPGPASAPEPATKPAPEPGPVRPAKLPGCPTLKQLNAGWHVLSSRADPEIDGERIWLLELRLSNRRSYPVYLTGTLSQESQFGPLPLVSAPGSRYATDLYFQKVKPGKSAIRMEVVSDEDFGPITWDMWSVDPTSEDSDAAPRCEPVSGL